MQLSLSSKVLSFSLKNTCKQINEKCHKKINKPSMYNSYYFKCLCYF